MNKLNSQQQQPPAQNYQQPPAQNYQQQQQQQPPAQNYQQPPAQNYQQQQQPPAQNYQQPPVTQQQQPTGDSKVHLILLLSFIYFLSFCLLSIHYQDFASELANINSKLQAIQQAINKPDSSDLQQQVPAYC